MQPEIVVVDGPKEVAAEAARRLAAEIECVLSGGEWCWLALPGGHFMARVYDHLARFSIAWSQVEFFFTDERCVPPSHPASCYGEAFDRLFTNPRIGEHQVHRIEAERPDREAVAEQYESELPEAFDVLLLEMGLDGHVASLFPGSSAFEPGAGLVAVVESPQKPHWRVTLGPTVLSNARRTVVVSTGLECAPMVRRVFDEETLPREVPAVIVREATWILDRAAASMLDAPRLPTVRS